VKVYIAGAMSGHEDFNRPAFNKAEALLKAKGYTVWNPAVHPDGFTHKEYMSVCLPVVKFCDAIYMLEGWELSVGATAEFGHAVAHNKIIWMEGIDACD